MGTDDRKLIQRLDLTDDQRKTLGKALGYDVKGVDVVELSLAETQKMNPAFQRPGVIVMCL